MYGIYMWFDKVDGKHPYDGVVISDSERSVCRGFIKAFENDRKMNPAEYELHKLADIDLVSGEIYPTIPLKVIDVKQVYSKAVKDDYGTIFPDTQSPSEK